MAAYVRHIFLTQMLTKSLEPCLYEHLFLRIFQIGRYRKGLKNCIRHTSGEYIVYQILVSRNKKPVVCKILNLTLGVLSKLWG